MSIQAIKSLNTAELSVQPIKVSSGYWNLRISSPTDPDKEMIIQESDLDDFSTVVLATRRLNTQVAIAKEEASKEVESEPKKGGKKTEEPLIS